MKPLFKTKSGISGLDEITGGGLPSGRPTLVCGGPGCGKTLFATQFIVKGITEYNEPGLFVTFEEKTEELAQNVASLGFDLEKLQRNKQLKMDFIHLERHEMRETGDYDLEGLFIRLDHAIRTIGAKRVVLDTVENLFAGLDNEAILRAELRRLFHWLKDRGVTSVITAEKGDGSLTRHGLEEYVSDCVIVLDHRVNDQVSTRRLRVVKYRGSMHGTNEYPFLIDHNGITVMPVTSVKLDKKVSSQRVSTGVPDLDDMLSGKGFYRGSSVLVSGTAGTGKTSIAAYFANATCSRNERCLYFAFEESPQQIARNMKSINLNLEQHVKKGLLKFHASRPVLYGLEMHLANMHKLIMEFRPSTVILDPISNLTNIGSLYEVNTMLTRLTDFLQSEGITILFTALNAGQSERLDEGVSSIVDTWLLVRDIEFNGERNRGLYVMKSRGMRHSNQVREFLITSKGLKLVDIYLGPEGILVGSAREVQESIKRSGKELEDQQQRERFARVRQQRGNNSTQRSKR
jgi:circadian clock protein KaiC